MEPWSHEQPLLLVLPADVAVEAALPELLTAPEILHLALPPLWALDKAGVDLPAALPDCKGATLDTLEDVLGTLLRLCDDALLRQLVQRTWLTAEERVRQHYLQLGVGQTMAMIFKAGPKTRDREPPAEFIRDRIIENGYEIQYRLAPEGDVPDWRAPPHEGTLTIYPFDPAAAASRKEAGVGPGSGAVLEIFAYEAGRDRHRDYWRRVASARGWQLAEARD